MKPLNVLFTVLLCSSCFYYTRAQVQTTHAYIGSGLGFATTDMNLTQSISVGVNKQVSVSEAVFVSVGAGYNFLNVPEYKRNQNYVTNWTSGPYRHKLNLTSCLTQHHLTVPLSINYSRNRFQFGAGLIFNYLLASTFEQHLNGVYVNPNHPDGQEPLNRSLQYVFNVPNTPNIELFPSMNISPMVRLGYFFTPKLGVVFQSDITIFEQPKYMAQVKPFRFVTFELQLNYLLRQSND